MKPDDYRTTSRFESLNAEAFEAHWRIAAILRAVEAECPAPKGKRWALTSQGLVLRDRGEAVIRHDVKMRSAPHGVACVEQRVDLDEVVVPGRLHAEHMGGGTWCVILGDGDLMVSATRRGVVIVERSADVRGAIVGHSDGSVTFGDLE